MASDRRQLLRRGAQPVTTSGPLGVSAFARLGREFHNGSQGRSVCEWLNGNDSVRAKEGSDCWRIICMSFSLMAMTIDH